MKFEITKSELIAEPRQISAGQMILKMLKDKGAPIEGIIFYTLEPGYYIEMSADPVSETSTYKFQNSNDE